MRNINQYANDYAKSHFEKIQVKYRKRLLMERLALYRHNYILEIGCALDPLYNHIKDYQKLVIVEPADTFYQAALKGAKGNNRIVCIHGYMEDKDILAKLHEYSFDFIVISGLLQEVEQPKQFLDAVYKLSNPCTTVHVNVPNAMSFHRLLGVEMGLIKSVYQKSETQNLLQQQTTFDIESLTRLIKSAGFKVIGQGSYFLKPFTHSQMHGLMKSGFLTDQMIEAFYSIVQHIPMLGSEIFIDAQQSCGKKKFR